MLKDLNKRADELAATCKATDPRREVYQGWTDDFDGATGAVINLAAALEYAAEILKKDGAVELTGRAREYALEISKALALLARG